MAYENASSERRPSNKQWWLIATTLLREKGIEIPESRAQASYVIGQLLPEASARPQKAETRKEILR